MKRLRTTIGSSLLATALLVMPVVALAQITPGSTGLDAAARGSGLATDCTGTACLTQVIGGAIGIVLGFLGIVLLCLFIYAGFLWMTAGGEVDQVKRAKSMLVNAVAGLAIIAASYAITSFVVSEIGRISGGGGGGTTSEAPADGSVADGGACTASSQCSNPLATCTDGVCTDIGL